MTPTIETILVAGLVYPGLLLALGLGVLLNALVGDNVTVRVAVAAMNNREGQSALASIVLTGIGLALLPWPLHPVAVDATWIWSWVAFELAFLVPLLPPLMAGAPLVVRAASREAQVGVAARSLFWLALSVGLVLHTQWAMLALPAHLLALAAALVAFPIAIGWGPFDVEQSITPGGTSYGLDPGAQTLVVLARVVRAGALLAALLIACLPVGVTEPWVGLLLAGAGFVTVGLVLRRVRGRWPRLTLPAILRMCWLRVFPISAAALVALVLVYAL